MIISLVVNILCVLKICGKPQSQNYFNSEFFLIYGNNIWVSKPEKSVYYMCSFLPHSPLSSDTLNQWAIQCRTTPAYQRWLQPTLFSWKHKSFHSKCAELLLPQQHCSYHSGYNVILVTLKAFISQYEAPKGEDWVELTIKLHALLP